MDGLNYHPVIQHHIRAQTVRQCGLDYNQNVASVSSS